MADQKDNGVSNQTELDKLNTSEERRKAVRNILAGSGVVIGAATSGAWTKPVLETVILPAHAQTSVVTLAGNADITPTGTTKIAKSTSVLDFFVAPAHATVSVDLAGACMTMSIDGGSSFTVDIQLGGGGSVSVTGTVSGGSLSGSGSGVTVSGSADLNAGTASGTVSDGLTTYNFTLDDSVVGCSPLATTTVAPTTTTTTTTTTTCMPGYGYDPMYGCLYTTVPPSTTGVPED